MLNGISKAFVLAGCLSIASVPVAAQEVIHALTGTVASIDSSGKTITVLTDNRSQGTFSDGTSSRLQNDADKNLRFEPAATDAAKKSGTYAIVFYSGGVDTRTAVALRSLGTGPFTRSSGTVVKFDNKEHSLAIKDETGAVTTYKIAQDTVAETGVGAVAGAKIRIDKGDQIRIISGTVSENNTALFIYAL